MAERAESPELFPSMYSGSEELSAADLSPEIPLVGSRPCRGSTSTGRRSGIGRRRLSFSSSGGGDSPDRSGDIEDRRRSGDVEDRRRSGDVENRQRSGDIEDRQHPGDIEDRGHTGDIADRRRPPLSNATNTVSFQTQLILDEMTKTNTRLDDFGDALKSVVQRLESVENLTFTGPSSSADSSVEKKKKTVPVKVRVC